MCNSKPADGWAEVTDSDNNLLDIPLCEGCLKIIEPNYKDFSIDETRREPGGNWNI